jgi:exopolyphosphatase/guanosine-5'-triphosphate,3'-diphosphate pyrophosphatase
MEKIAIFELGTSFIKLSVVKLESGVFFCVEKQLSEFVGIDKDMQSNGMIKAAKVRECIAIVEMYKQVAQALGVSKFHCSATSNLSKAVNYSAFIDEINLVLDLKFKLLEDGEEMSLLYTAIVNTLDVPKGLIVHISTASTRILNYCRRVILGSVTIPIGAANFTGYDDFMKQLKNVGESVRMLDEDVKIIGSGEVFESFSRLSRKKRHYPVNIDHNYVVTRAEFEDCFEFLKGLDLDKKTKLKGISGNGIDYIMSGMEITEAIMDYTVLSEIIFSKHGKTTGIALRAALPEIEERPVQDVFNHSLETIIRAERLDVERAHAHYNFANMLYSQLRVLHRLPRHCNRIMKAAAYFYEFDPKVSYYAVLNADICGMSHKDIVMSAFVSACRTWDDFSLAEWVKYKDIMTEEDLDAVRKLSVITAMADVMNMRRRDIIKDVSGDILGDSVIIKFVTELNQKNPKMNVNAAAVEIFHSKKFSKEFVKVFKKNVEIL